MGQLTQLMDHDTSSLLCRGELTFLSFYGDFHPLIPRGKEHVAIGFTVKLTGSKQGCQRAPGTHDGAVVCLFVVLKCCNTAIKRNTVLTQYRGQFYQESRVQTTLREYPKTQKQHEHDVKRSGLVFLVDYYPWDTL